MLICLIRLKWDRNWWPIILFRADHEQSLVSVTITTTQHEVSVRIKTRFPSTDRQESRVAESRKWWTNRTRHNKINDVDSAAPELCQRRQQWTESVLESDDWSSKGTNWSFSECLFCFFFVSVPMKEIDASIDRWIILCTNGDLQFFIIVRTRLGMSHALLDAVISKSSFSPQWMCTH